MKAWILVIGLLFIMYGNGYAASQRPSYDRLETLFLAGQFETVVSESDALIRAGYGRKDEIYYLKGLSELKLNRFVAARESFQYIVSKSSGSRKMFDAYLGIGDSYMLAGALNDAVGVYVGMLDNFRAEKNLPIVYSRLAGCYKGLGVRDKAEYYEAMAKQAGVAPTPVAASQVASPQTRATAAQVAAPQARATASQAAAPQARPPAPKASAPVSNISPKDAGEVDVIMATGQSISVQVGSFKNRRNAEKLAKKLAASGFDSRVEIPVAQGEKLYRVKVGRVSSRSEAEALKTRLVAAGYATKICDGETCD